MMVCIGLIPFVYSCKNQENKVGCCDSRALNYDAEANIDNGQCNYSDAYIYSDPDSLSQPDADGNLIVMNESREALHLYINNVHAKVIPPRTSNYLVNIPAYKEKQELAIYKVSETDDVKSPDPEKIFKKWVVILPPDLLPGNRLKWVISEFATSDGNGTIRFNYPTQQDGFQYTYNTDIYLQSKTGACMVSLNPGNGHKARIDYGVYKFYYRYWYSDSGNAASQIEVGWLESPYITLNAAHNETDIRIPGFNAIPENVAMLKIVNHLSDAVNVYWGNAMIEDLVYGYENTEGLSALSSGHETLYYLDEGENCVSAREFSGVISEELDGITLVKGLMTQIEFGGDYEDVYCVNKSGEQVFIGVPYYTGIAIDGQTERFVKLPKAENVNVFNADSTFFKQVTIREHNLVVE